MVLDLSASTNLYGPPPVVAEALRGDAGWVQRYLDFDGRDELASHLQAFHEVDVPCIPTHGASSALLQLPRLLEARAVVHALPAFWQYGMSATLAGVPALAAQTLDDLSDAGLSRLENLIGQEHVCVLGNPNNPTGQMYEPSRLRELVERHSGVTWIVDETYLMFRSDWRERTCIPLAARYQNILVVSSLSKVLCLPGIRLGSIFCHPRAYDKLIAAFFCFDVSYPALLVSRLLGSSDVAEYVQMTQTALSVARRAMYEDLKASCALQKVLIPAANFMLVQARRNFLHSGDLSEWMSEHAEIEVRSGREFQSLDPTWARFCFGTPSTDERLRRAFAELSHALS